MSQIALDFDHKVLPCFELQVFSEASLAAIIENGWEKGFHPESRGEREHH